MDIAPTGKRKKTEIHIVSAHVPYGNIVCKNTTLYKQNEMYSNNKGFKINLKVLRDNLLNQVWKRKASSNSVVLTIDTNTNMSDGAIYSKLRPDDLKLRGALCD